MANSGKAKPQLLSIPQLNAIRANHPPTADAIRTILEYLNANLSPVQGNKVAPK